jgi:hypothetical protein
VTQGLMQRVGAHPFSHSSRQVALFNKAPKVTRGNKALKAIKGFFIPTPSKPSAKILREHSRRATTVDEPEKALPCIEAFNPIDSGFEALVVPPQEASL